MVNYIPAVAQHFCLLCLQPSRNLEPTIKQELCICFCFTRYLPANVTLFNAYAIHGTEWGEASPSEEDKRYEALYPVDPK